MSFFKARNYSVYLWAALVFVGLVCHGLPMGYARAQVGVRDSRYDDLIHSILDKDEAFTMEAGTAGMSIYSYLNLHLEIAKIRKDSDSDHFQSCLEALALSRDARPWVRRRAYHAVASFCKPKGRLKDSELAFLQGLVFGLRENDIESQYELTILANRLRSLTKIDIQLETNKR